MYESELEMSFSQLCLTLPWLTSSLKYNHSFEEEILTLNRFSIIIEDIQFLWLSCRGSTFYLLLIECYDIPGLNNNGLNYNHYNFAQY